MGVHSVVCPDTVWIPGGSGHEDKLANGFIPGWWQEDNLQAF